jgi:anthranilate synthase component 2
MIVLIDNYDSFVFNLERYLIGLGQETTVIRSDASSAMAILERKPTAIVISPGPKTPDSAGVSLELIRLAWQTIPILGVCLGHQAIGQAFGGTILRAPRPVHGQPAMMQRRGDSRLLANVPQQFVAARYHSLVIDRDSMPDQLTITAETVDGLVMAIEHRTANLFGVQFHPESILTELGYAILAGFLDASNIARTVPLPQSDFAIS